MGPAEQQSGQQKNLENAMMMDRSPPLLLFWSPLPPTHILSSEASMMGRWAEKLRSSAEEPNWAWWMPRRCSYWFAVDGLAPYQQINRYKAKRAQCYMSASMPHARTRHCPCTLTSPPRLARTALMESLSKRPQEDHKSGSEIYYQNECQSRFSGVYLAFEVFDNFQKRELRNYWQFPISFYRRASRF